MKTLSCDVLVIGGGPAGLAAAVSAREAGAEEVVILERNNELGGILPQCIHTGFGVRVFGEDLSGPEYAWRWIRRAQEADLRLLSETMVLALSPERRVIATNSRDGLLDIAARAIVLAMGCRERPRGALAIPGTRPAGVYTAGTAQRLVNIEGYMPGERFVILGSGDIGMIMARRLTLEGATVVEVLEIQPYLSGLRRNLVQCIRDFGIPLSLCTTVTEVRGRDRVEAVVASQVDAQWRPIPGTERVIPCDTLLLSVGLIPENEISRMAGVPIDPITGGPYVDQDFSTRIPGIYAAGNVVHVYDLVDDVTESALRAGRCAARFARQGIKEQGPCVRTQAGENVRYVVPHTVYAEALAEEPVTLHLRVRQPIERAVRLEAVLGGRVLASRRLRYVRPGEMVALTLPTEAAPLLATAGEEVTLSVRVIT